MQTLVGLQTSVCTLTVKHVAYTELISLSCDSISGPVLYRIHNATTIFKNLRRIPWAWPTRLQLYEDFLSISTYRLLMVEVDRVTDNL